MPRTFWVGMFCAAALAGGALAQKPHGKPPSASAQQDAPARRAAATKDPYTAEPLVVERLDTVYRYNADGTGTKVETRVTHVQNEAGARSVLVLSLPYIAGLRRIEIVYLRVRKANGTVIDTPPTDAQEVAAPVTQIAPVYGDMRVVQIGTRGLAVGDRVESQIRTVTTQAEVGGHFWGTESFGQRQVVLERTVELHVPASRNVLVVAPKNAPVTTDEGADKVYRWKGSQLKPTPKPAAPGASSASDDDTAEDERIPPMAWTTFHNWAEVGEWYRGLAGTGASPTPELKARADQVLYGVKTADGRIRGLYAYVSSEVRSIDVSLGVGQYGPHPAAEVLRNLYGDSNDKNAVLLALLRSEGLKGSTVLVAAGKEINEAVPSPGWFNHVITLTGEGTHEDVWLDTTPEIAPFRFLAQPLRDRTVLVIPETGQPVLRQTPTDLPFAGFNKFEAKGTLTADGALHAHVELTMRGDEEMRYRVGLRNVGPAQWDRITEFFLNGAGIAGTGTNTVGDRADDISGPLHVEFDLSRAPYGDWDNYRILPLQPGLSLPFSDRKTSPDRAIEFGGKRTDTAVSRITLPPGYGADLPEAEHVHTAFATLDKSYRLETEGKSKVLVTERTLAITADKLPQDQWPTYRKFLDEVGESEPWVQLTSAGAVEKGTHGPPAASMDNPAAAQLVAKADMAIETRNSDEAMARLNEAKKLNPRQPLLWSSYGVIALRAGKMDEAVEDYRRELKDHPSEAQVSQMLAMALVAEGKTDEAAAALRAALVQDPADVRTVTSLARVLEAKDSPGAQKVLREGLVASPDSLDLKLALGTLLVKAGKRDEGGALLVAVANASQDPGQLNDAAYFLSETPVNLRVAETTARKAIQLLNAASARPVAGVASGAALRRSALLVAAWDTYGWVLYREGNISEAEPWLRSAWADSYGAEAGTHFGTLLQKEGKEAEGAHVLRLAAEGERGALPEASSEEGGGAGAHGGEISGAKRPAQGSVSERTFAVPGTAAAGAGTALFEYDFAFTAPIQVRFVSGTESLADLAPALRKVDTKTMIPPGSPAHLLRRGVLRCAAGGSCTLEMLSMRAALGE